MKKEVTDEWEVQDDIRRENVFQGMLTQFDEDADSALAVLRSNVKKGTVEEVRGQDLFETDYDGGSLEACIEARLNSFIFRKDRDDFRNLFMMDNLVERYYDGLGPVSMVGYCKRASGRQCFVRFTGSVLVNPLTGDVMSFGLEKECNMEMVAQALNEKVLAQQYDMVSYIVGDHYGVVIGNSSSIKVGSIFPRKREGLYDEYINSQVMPVAVGTSEELEKLREALSVERIANELADSDSYTVDLTCEIDGAHYNKRFSYHSVDQDANFYIVLKTDMTEVIHAERERNEILAQTLKEAERANQAKTVFLSNMSHEIRTPMNAIIGLNTLALKDENLSSETRGYLEKIGESARHLLSLINDILDMSRIESGRMSLRIEEFSFGGMLDQINTMVQSQCSDKGLTFECQVIGDLEKNYMGDSTKLKQILLNILGNAIKFTDAPGAVTLRVEKTASFDNRSTFRFSIKDTGIGISEEFLPNIFEPFTQEDSSRSNRYGSTGLGMAITRNIVEMMNGTINVSSQKGAGTDERPHRMAYIVSRPNDIKTTSKAYIEKVAGYLPKEERPQRYNNYQPTQFNVVDWMSKHGIRYKEKSSGDYTKYILDECPFDHNHKSPDSMITVGRSGAIGFRCLHNSCQKYGWHDLRLLFEPDAYDNKYAADEERINKHCKIAGY